MVRLLLEHGADPLSRAQQRQLDWPPDDRGGSLTDAGSAFDAARQVGRADLLRMLRAALRRRSGRTTHPKAPF
jgi:hypothetical protein